jgi:hypothetical protein
MSTQTRERSHVSRRQRSESCQNSGGRVGGCLTTPRDVSSAKDSARPSTKYGCATLTAGRMTPARVKHLRAHAVDLELSGVLQHGQHDMSGRSAVIVSTGGTDVTASPIAGDMTTERARSAARIVRIRAILFALSDHTGSASTNFIPFEMRNICDVRVRFARRRLVEANIRIGSFTSI